MINRQVKLLEAHATKLRAAGNVSTIKFAGLGFRNMQECHAWSMSNFPGRRYGLMLDRICGADELNSSAGNIWKTMESLDNYCFTWTLLLCVSYLFTSFVTQSFYLFRGVMYDNDSVSKIMVDGCFLTFLIIDLSIMCFPVDDRQHQVL